MIQEIIYPLISAFLTAAITFVFTKRKYKAETEGLDLSNVRENLKLYQDMVTDLRDRYDQDRDRMEKEIEVLRKQVAALQVGLDDCRRKNR